MEKTLQYTVRAGRLGNDGYRAALMFPTRYGNVIFSAEVPQGAVACMREHLRRALREASVSGADDFLPAVGEACGATGDEIAGIWDTIAPWVSRGIRMLPIPGAGLISTGVDALTGLLQSRAQRAAAPQRPAGAPAAPRPAVAVAPALPAAAASLAGLARGAVSPAQLAPQLAAAAALGGALRAAPSVFGSAAPDLVALTRGILDAGDTVSGAELGMPALQERLARSEALGDPRIAEYLRAARNLHAAWHGA